MKYFTAVDAVEGLESALDTDRIMLTGEDCLLRMENQRLLMQSLMIDPPETEHDPRLVQMMRSQTMLWSEKIEECVKKQLCIRLPDRPIDAFLPATPAEISRLSAFMNRPAEWLRGQAAALRDVNPDLSCRGCRMLIHQQRAGVPCLPARAVYHGAAMRRSCAVRPDPLCFRLPGGGIPGRRHLGICGRPRHRMKHRRGNRHAARGLHRGRPGKACRRDCI